MAVTPSAADRCKTPSDVGLKEPYVLYGDQGACQYGGHIPAKPAKPCVLVVNLWMDFLASTGSSLASTFSRYVSPLSSTIYSPVGLPWALMISIVVGGAMLGYKLYAVSDPRQKMRVGL